jgi:hypothetical protein
MKPQLTPGSWVKLVNGQTVINGYVRSVTETYATIHGLPPIKLKDWAIIIEKKPQ